MYSVGACTCVHVHWLYMHMYMYIVYISLMILTTEDAKSQTTQTHVAEVEHSLKESKHPAKDTMYMWQYSRNSYGKYVVHNAETLVQFNTWYSQKCTAHNVCN